MTMQILATARFSQRRGFSLMELFLVITILAVVTSLTFPMLRKPLNKSVVQDAGQQLMRELSSARTQAIDAARPLLFQYQPGTGRYYIGEQDQRSTNGLLSNEDLSDASQGGRLGSGEPAKASRPAQWQAVMAGVQTLPQDVVFSDNAPIGESVESDRQNNESRKTDEFSGDPPDQRESPSMHRGETQDETAKWTVPLRFYPSGRIRPAKITLKGPDGYSVDVELQGLAGRVWLSKVRH